MPIASPVAPDQAPLATAEQAYDAGLCLSAWNAIPGTDSPWAIRDPDSAILAARCASNLGAEVLPEVLLSRAYASAPEDPAAVYFHCHRQLRFRGALTAIETCEQADWQGWPALWREHQRALFAQCQAAFRDHAAAQATLAQAIAALPDDPWLAAVEADILEQADRLEDARAAAERSWALRPGYRPAWERRLSLTLSCDGPEAVLELADEACRSLESIGPWSMRALALKELERFDELESALDDWERMAVLAGPRARKWLWSNRAEVARHRGDRSGYLAALQQVDNDYHKRLAGRIENLPHLSGEKRLEVPAVRQDERTCAPATLASIARFWGSDADQREVAERICFDGTPAHVERSWAEEEDFITIEFRITWDATTALIDRGLPFTLTTTAPTSAHLQAVVGYDPDGRQLLIRDPGSPLLNHADGELLYKHQAAYGPRGMVLVPRTEAHRLDGLSLPEATGYDCLHRLRQCLEHHDRPGAEAALQAMVSWQNDEVETGDADEHANASSAGDDHRLTLWARLNLAGYDNDLPAQVAVLDQLRERFPDDVWLHLQWLSRTGSSRPWPKQRDLLAEAAAGNGAHPVFLRDYAAVLAKDPRHRSQAETLLRRAMAGLGVDPYTLGQLATCRDNAGDLNGCRRFRRWAMTSDPTSEHLVSAWIADERRSADGFTGHDFLWERHRKWSQLERGPSLTLLDTLRADEKHDEADALEAELDRRFPNDPDIVFHKADRWIGTDKQAQVAALLDGLETGGHAGRLARARADLFRSEGRFSEAIAVVNQRLEEEPLALDLIDRLFGYHATFHGRERAIACSKDLVDRFPEHMGLRHRYCSWLSQRPADKAEALGAILIRDPEDAWTIRELAWTRFNLGQTAEAERLLGEASALDPDSIGTLNLAADLAMRAGDRETARAKLRAVQDLDLDLHWSNERLLDLPTGRQDLIAELDHFADALATRHHDGDALRLWFSTARATFDPADFEQRLTRLAESCADHWQMSQLHAIWLRTRDRLDEAAAVLAAARKRWPEAVVFLNDAAAVAKAQGRREEEEGLLKEAMRLAPSWTAPLRRLAEMRLEADDQKAAEALIERARRIDPRIADNHRLAADLARTRGDEAAALAALRKAVEQDREDEDLWMMVYDLDPDQAVSDAKAWCAAQPGSGIALRITATLVAQRDPKEAIDISQRAVALEPGSEESADHLAWLLARTGDAEAAQALCSDERWQGRAPLMLRRRRALINHEIGKGKEAVRILEQVVKEDPADATAWDQLRRIADDVGQDTVAERALTMYSRLRPTDTHALLLTAQRQRDAKNTGLAHKTWKQVLRLEPTNHYALIGLSNLLMENDEFDEIDALIAGTPGNETLPATRYISVLVGIETKDTERWTTGLEALLALPDVPAWMPHDVNGKISKGRNSSHANKLAKRMITEPKPGFGIAAAEFCTQRHTKTWSSWGLNRWLKQHRALPGEFAAVIAGLWMDETSVKAKAPRMRVLTRMADSHRALLQSSVYAWGKTGFALTNAAHWQASVDWHAQWQRPGVEGWMLMNRAWAHLATGDRVGAMESHLGGLVIGDNWRSAHARWLALAQALAGQFDDAQRHHALAGPASGNEGPDFGAILLDQLIQAALDQDPARARATLERALKRPQVPFLAAWAKAYRTVTEDTIATLSARGSGGWFWRWRMRRKLKVERS